MRQAVWNQNTEHRFLATVKSDHSIMHVSSTFGHQTTAGFQVLRDSHLRFCCFWSTMKNSHQHQAAVSFAGYVNFNLYWEHLLAVAIINHAMLTGHLLCRTVHTPFENSAVHQMSCHAIRLEWHWLLPVCAFDTGVWWLLFTKFYSMSSICA